MSELRDLSPAVLTKPPPLVFVVRVAPRRNHPQLDWRLIVGTDSLCGVATLAHVQHSEWASSVGGAGSHHRYLMTAMSCDSRMTTYLVSPIISPVPVMGWNTTLSPTLTCWQSGPAAATVERVWVSSPLAISGMYSRPLSVFSAASAALMKTMSESGCKSSMVSWAPCLRRR